MKQSGLSILGGTTLFQSVGQGSKPMKPHKYVVECNFSDIRHLFEKYHYKGGHMDGGISFCLALIENGDIIGGAVMGKLRHEKAYNALGKTIEIRRMACEETAPKNTESYFLSKVVWWVKSNKLADTIVSYADQTVGHKGTIYRASNFKLMGETSATIHVFWDGVRYHPRSLSIDRPYSYKLREAVKTGEAKVEKGLPKLIFIYKI